MSTVATDLQTAFDRHQAGDLPQAERLYREILQSDPGHCEAMHLLGVLAHQTGNHTQAIELIRAAITLAGSPRAMMCCNLGAAYQALGELDAAEEQYRQTIAVQPNYLDAHHNLAAVWAARGQHEQAVTAYQTVLASNPQHRNARLNLGKSLQQLGRMPEAAECFQQVLAEHPHDVEALLNLGTMLGLQDQLESAAEHFQQILQLTPAHPQANFNLGRIRQDQERLDEAVAHYRSAVESAPDHAHAWNNLGVVLKSLKQFGEAESCLRKVLQLNPHDATVHFNLGNVLREQERHQDAIASYRHGLQIQPNHLESYINLGTALTSLGELQAAEAQYRTALKLQPNYIEAHLNLASVLQLQGLLNEAATVYERGLRIDPACESLRSNSLMLDLYLPEKQPGDILERHQQWAERYQDRDSGGEPFRQTFDPQRRLRIGYVSPDFRVHPVGFFIKTILQQHDRAQFELTCYAEQPDSDHVTEGIRNSVDHWRSTFRQADAAVASLIREDEIDILIDLAGHTSGNRLPVFAYRPAPVQITYLGYGTTTGLSTMDYRMTDAVADPVDERNFHTEELLRLPAGILCYSPPEDVPDVSTLPMQQNGFVTFGSFNNLSKLSVPVLDLWAEVLLSVPQSRLILKNRSFADASVRERYRNLFSERGVVADRIELSGPTKTIAEHLALYERVDLGLDPFPYNGATTTCESLWMGVPVVTLRGSQFVGRMTASLLTRVGLTEFITQTPQAYVHMARAWAEAPDRLAQLRRELRPAVANSPLCDQAAYVRDLEALYRTVWQNWCSNSLTR